MWESQAPGRLGVGFRPWRWVRLRGVTGRPHPAGPETPQGVEASELRAGHVHRTATGLGAPHVRWEAEDASKPRYKGRRAIETGPLCVPMTLRTCTVRKQLQNSLKTRPSRHDHDVVMQEQQEGSEISFHF